MKAISIQDRLSKSRIALLRDQPWFGSLAMKLEVIVDDAVGTACTDGTYLKFSGEYVEKLSDKQLIGLIAHEVMHCAMLHPFRMEARDHELWNIACDFVINGELIKAGFTLPDGGLVSSAFDGMSSEQVYSLLDHQISNGQPRPKSGKDSMGEFEPGAGDKDDQDQDGGGDKPTPLTAHDWEIMAEQAAQQATKAGKMSADIDRLLKQGHQQTADWVALTREFIENTIASDYCPTKPNRRVYAATRLLTPGLKRENCPKLGVVVDTSGSIDGDMIAAFSAEIGALVREAQPESIEIVYADSEIKNIQEFDCDSFRVEHLQAKGGGGTSFQPALDYFSEQDERPAAVIYFTDLENFDSPLTEPEYPVLWVTREWDTAVGEFGQTVRMKK